MSWQAVVICSEQTPGGDHFHFEIKVDASSKEEALSGVTKLTEIIAKGKTTIFRFMPEADSQVDFNSKETLHRGYSRFTLVDRPGDWIQGPMAVDRSFCT